MMTIPRSHICHLKSAFCLDFYSLPVPLSNLIKKFPWGSSLFYSLAWLFLDHWGRCSEQTYQPRAKINSHSWNPFAEQQLNSGKETYCLVQTCLMQLATPQPNRVQYWSFPYFLTLVKRCTSEEALPTDLWYRISWCAYSNRLICLLVG